MRDERGWFADIDQDQPENYPYRWQPCLETGTGYVPCLEVWFATAEECERYIREDIIPIAGRMADNTAGAET